MTVEKTDSEIGNGDKVVSLTGVDIAQDTWPEEKSEEGYRQNNDFQHEPTSPKRLSSTFESRSPPTTQVTSDVVEGKSTWYTEFSQEESSKPHIDHQVESEEELATLKANLRPINHGRPVKGILKPPPPPMKSIFKRDWFQSLNSRSQTPASLNAKSLEPQMPHVTPSGSSTSTSILTSAFRRLNATGAASKMNGALRHSSSPSSDRVDPFQDSIPSPLSPDPMFLAPQSEERAQKFRPGVEVLALRSPERISYSSSNTSLKEDVLSPTALKRVRFSIGQLTTEYLISTSKYTHDNVPPPELKPGSSPYRRNEDVTSPASPDSRKRKRPGPRQVLSLYLKSCQMREEFPLDRLVEVLREASGTNGKQLTTLDLSMERLDARKADPLADILTLDCGFQRLVLSGCELTDEPLKAISHALLSSNCIPWLSLEGNKRIKANGWKYIAVLVGQSSSLIYLDLSNTSFDRKAAELLVQALTADNGDKQSRKEVSLRTLKLDKCGLKGSVLEVLGPGIRKSHLQHLSLRNNRINHQGAVWVGVLMKDYEEDMENNGYGAKSNIGMHKKEGGLESIDVRGNEIRTGVQYIAASLRRNSTLRVLQLSDNKIDVRGLVQLGEALRYNTTLEILDLSKNPCCGPSIDGVVSLRRPIMVNQNLKKLFLSDTHVSSESAIAIAELLPDAKSLEHLDLTANYDIDMAGIMALSVAVKLNTTLQCLDVNIPPNDVEMSRLSRDILQACIRNTEAAQKASDDMEPIISPILQSELAKAAQMDFRDKYGIDWKGVRKICVDCERGINVMRARLSNDAGTSTTRLPADTEVREWHARLMATLNRLVMLIERATDEAILAKLLDLHDQLPPLLMSVDRTYTLNDEDPNEVVSTLDANSKDPDSARQELSVEIDMKTREVPISPSFSIIDSDDSEVDSEAKSTSAKEKEKSNFESDLSSGSGSVTTLRSPIENLRKNFEEEEGEILRRGRRLLEDERSDDVFGVQDHEEIESEDLKKKLLASPVLEREEMIGSDTSNEQVSL